LIALDLSGSADIIGVKVRRYNENEKGNVAHLRLIETLLEIPQSPVESTLEAEGVGTTQLKDKKGKGLVKGIINFPFKVVGGIFGLAFKGVKAVTGGIGEYASDLYNRATGDGAPKRIVAGDGSNVDPFLVKGPLKCEDSPDDACCKAWAGKIAACERREAGEPVEREPVEYSRNIKQKCIEQHKVKDFDELSETQQEICYYEFREPVFIPPLQRIGDEKKDDKDKTSRGTAIGTTTPPSTITTPPVIKEPVSVTKEKEEPAKPREKRSLTGGTRAIREDFDDPRFQSIEPTETVTLSMVNGEDARIYSVGGRELGGIGITPGQPTQLSVGGGGSVSGSGGGGVTGGSGTARDVETGEERDDIDVDAEPSEDGQGLDVTVTPDEDASQDPALIDVLVDETNEEGSPQQKRLVFVTQPEPTTEPIDQTAPRSAAEKASVFVLTLLLVVLGTLSWLYFKPRK